MPKIRGMNALPITFGKIRMNEIILSAMMFLNIFGYTSVNNELIGQVKRIHQNTPIICPKYTEVDISLGTLQGGTGSISRQDIRLLVSKDSDTEILKFAADRGSLIKIEYDRRRISMCVNNEQVTKVTILENK